MADDGYPYPGVSQITTAAEWEGFFSAVQLDGVVSGLAPTIQSGARTASVGSGGAYLRGFFKPISSTTAKAVPAASAQDRVDRLVLRLDRDAATAATYIVPTVLTGTAGTATPPALTRGSTGVWDLPISRWTSKSDGSLTGLVDERYGPGWFTSAARAGGLAPVSPARTAVEIDTGQTYSSDGSTWTSLYQDTGWVTLAINGANGNSWTANNVCRVRRIGKVVHLRIAVRRWNNYGLGTSDANGSQVLILPAEYRPSVMEPNFAYRGINPVAMEVEPSGAVTLYALVANIPASTTVFGNATWFVD